MKQKCLIIVITICLISFYSCSTNNIEIKNNFLSEISSALTVEQKENIVQKYFNNNKDNIYINTVYLAYLLDNNKTYEAEKIISKISKQSSKINDEIELLDYYNVLYNFQIKTDDFINAIYNIDKSLNILNKTTKLSEENKTKTIYNLLNNKAKCFYILKNYDAVLDIYMNNKDVIFYSNDIETATIYLDVLLKKNMLSDLENATCVFISKYSYYKGAINFECYVAKETRNIEKYIYTSFLSIWELYKNEKIKKDETLLSLNQYYKVFENTNKNEDERIKTCINTLNLLINKENDAIVLLEKAKEIIDYPPVRLYLLNAKIQNEKLSKEVLTELYNLIIYFNTDQYYIYTLVQYSKKLLEKLFSFEKMHILIEYMINLNMNSKFALSGRLELGQFFDLKNSESKYILTTMEINNFIKYYFINHETKYLEPIINLLSIKENYYTEIAYECIKKLIDDPYLKNALKNYSKNASSLLKIRLEKLLLID